MAGCSDIDVGSAADCANLPAGGTRARVIAVNFEDITDWDETGGKITQVTMRTGTKGYEFTGFRNDVKKSEEVINPGIGINQFKHNVGWVIYERTQAQKNNIERLARGRFVLFVENKGKDSDSYEVVGKDVGVEIVPGPVRNAHENGGFFMVNFSTPEGEFEGKLPQTLGTTYAAGTALIADILSS